MDEIQYAEEKFNGLQNLLELQVWEAKTAEHFANKGYPYSVISCNDGSWWITDESRYPD